jgi:hypothetical protein
MFSKQYLPSYGPNVEIPETEDDKKWENVYFKPYPLPKSVIENNQYWENYKAGEFNFYPPYPTTWKHWGIKNDIKTHQTSVEYYAKKLVVFGLLSPLFLDYSINVDSSEQSTKIGTLIIKTYKNLIPNNEDIYRQLKYIYSNPIRFLSVVQYTEFCTILLGIARSHKLWNISPTKAKELLRAGIGVDGEKNRIEQLKKFYKLDDRIPKQILDKYFNATNQERYMTLNEVILQADYVKKPIILVRGQKSPYPWVSHTIGETIVSNSILSTTFNYDVASSFGKYIFIYHLPPEIPRLYVGKIESEILIPESLEMRLEQISIGYENKINYHIRVIGIKKSATRAGKKHDPKIMAIIEKFSDFIKEFIFKTHQLFSVYKQLFMVKVKLSYKDKTSEITFNQTSMLENLLTRDMYTFLEKIDLPEYKNINFNVELITIESLMRIVKVTPIVNEMKKEEPSPVEEKRYTYSYNDITTHTIKYYYKRSELYIYNISNKGSFSQLSFMIPIEAGIFKFESIPQFDTTMFKKINYSIKRINIHEKKSPLISPGKTATKRSKQTPSKLTTKRQRTEKRHTPTTKRHTPTAKRHTPTAKRKTSTAKRHTPIVKESASKKKST